MRKLLVAVLLMCSSLALAEDAIDPAAVVKQLYQSSARNYRHDASYSIWSDGTVSFSVSIDRDTSVHGYGRDAKSALEDLARKSAALEKTLVPEAERRKTATSSLTEAVKAILFQGKVSQ